MGYKGLCRGFTWVIRDYVVCSMFRAMAISMFYCYYIPYLDCDALGSPDLLPSSSIITRSLHNIASY